MVPVAEAGRRLRTGGAASAVGPSVSSSGSRWTREDGRVFDPAAAAFLPPAAGLYSATSSGTSPAPVRRGRRLAVSLLDPGASLPLPDSHLEATEPATGGAGLPAWSWLALLALVLLLLEWHLFHRGRLP